MTDNTFDILARLDTTASGIQGIKDDIKKIEKVLRNDESARIHLIAKLDDATKNSIQSQLTEITKQAKAPTIQVGVQLSNQTDTKNATQKLNEGLKTTQTQAKATAKDVNTVAQSIETIGKTNVSKTVTSMSQLDNVMQQFLNKYKSITGTDFPLMPQIDNIKAKLQSINNVDVLSNFSKSIEGVSTSEGIGRVFSVIKNLKVDANASQKAIEGLTQAIYSQFTASVQIGKNDKGLASALTKAGATKVSTGGYTADIQQLQSLVEKFPQLQTYIDGINERFKTVANSTLTASEAFKVYQQALSGENNVPNAISQNAKNVDTLTASAETAARAVNNLTQAEQNLNVGANVTEGLTSGLKTAETQANKTEQALNSVNAVANSQSVVGAKSTGGYFYNKDEILNSIKLFGQEEDAVRTLEEKFKSLGATVSSVERADKNGFLKGFTVEVKSATTGIEKFNYAWKNVGTENNPNFQFELKNITAANASIEKYGNAVKETIAKYTQNFEKFKSTNNSVLSGLSAPLADFQEKLNGLQNGVTSISDVEIAFKKLNAEVAKIQAPISGKLNPFDAAGLNISKGEETIRGLRAEFSGLNNAPKEINSELTKCAKLLKEVKVIESEQGRTEQWSKAYRAYADSIDTVTAKIKALKKEQANTATTQIYNTADLKANGVAYMDKVYNTIEKQMSRIKSMASSKGWELVDVTGVEKADGLIKKLNLTIRDTDGALKQVAMQREKLQGDSRVHSGLMQVGDVKVLQTAMKAELDAEKQLQAQKDEFNRRNLNAIDYEIKKREEESRIFSQQIKSQIEEQVALENRSKKTVESNIATLNKLSSEKAFSYNSSNPQVQKTTNEISVLLSKYEELKSKMSQATPTEFPALVTQLETLNKSFASTTTTAQTLKNTLNNTKAEENLKNKIAILTNQIVTYKNANGKAMASNQLSSNSITFSAELDNMLAKLKTCASSADYDIIAKNFRKIRTEISAAGLTGGTFFQNLWKNMKKFASWMGMTSAMARVSMYVRQAVTELKDLDTILTEISKTSERTEESLKYLGKTAFDTASKYGRTASDYLSGVQEMSRAGFGEEQSEQMAELSVLAQSAGDMTADLANEYLIATNAGYKLAGDTEKLNSVLDSQNYITNRNALSMSELAEATKIVASQADLSGVGIDKLTAAVGTMIATTQQGGEVAARAFKGILMNLQQVKADADDIGDGDEAITDESLTKYEKACEDLGVSLKEVKNGIWALRDPMEILEELSQAVAKESEDSVKVANLISAVGGKYRGGQLSALLKNWDAYKKMLSEFNSDEAIGSAYEEAMKSANNWQGELNKLSNTWTDFVENFVNSDLAKGFLKVINTLVGGLENVTELLGGLPTLVGAFAASLSFKNVGELLNTPPYVPLQLCA